MAGRQLRICCHAGPVRDALRDSKIDQSIPIFETLADALR
jgi:hypothetical protein